MKSNNVKSTQLIRKSPTILYYTTLSCTVCTVLYCTVLYSTVSMGVCTSELCRTSYMISMVVMKCNIVLLMKSLFINLASLLVL